MVARRNTVEIRKTALAILQYVREHPYAKDTAPGIAKWWVGEDEKAVEEALRLLTEEGVLKKRGSLYQRS